MEKSKILNKSFRIILSKYLNSDNYKVINYDDDDEYRNYCAICDKFRIERFYKNHFKSRTHTNIIHKRQQLKDFK